MQCATAHGYAVFTHDLDFATMLALSGARGPIVLQVRGPNVLPAAVAGHADLAAAGLKQHGFVEVGLSSTGRSCLAARAARAGVKRH